MHDRDHLERTFVWCLGNQVVTHQNEPQGARGEVWAPVAFMGKRNEPAEGVKNFRDDPIGCVRVFLGKIIAKRGIRLTQVTPTCSMRLDGGLSSRSH